MVNGSNDIELGNLNSLKVVARLYTASHLVALAVHGSTLAVGDYNGTVYFLRV